MRRAVPLIMVLSLLAWAPAVRADAPEVEIARGHFRRGAAHYEESRFTEAAAELELARRALPLPELDYNLGRCYEAIGDIDRALEAYRRFRGHAPTAASVAEVDDRVRLLEIASPLAKVRVARDRARLEATQRWRRLYPAAIAAGVVAVGAGVAAGVLEGLTRGHADQLALGCPPACDPALYDTARRTQAATYASFGIALGAAAIDLSLWGVALDARRRMQPPKDSPR